jgi:hypothetical protein
MKHETGIADEDSWTFSRVTRDLGIMDVADRFTTHNLDLVEGVESNSSHQLFII